MEVPPAISGGVVMGAAEAGAVPAAGGNGVIIGAAEAGATNKVTAVDEGKMKPAESKKRTKTMRVQQGYIDSLLKHYPFTPYPWEPEVIEKRIPNPVTREKFLVRMAPFAAIMKATRGKDEDIVKQYLAQGYAEEEVEVSDDEEEEV